jgi:drug/metabolite transporter (DMT)-like permease
VPLAALGLILSAAVMHAGWNVMVKQAKQKQVFMWCGLVVGTLLFIVVPVLSTPLPLRAWPYILSSALMEALYFIALTWAYDIDDFSLVYPLARGTAPVFLMLWTALFLGESPHLTGVLGIILLVIGLVIVGSGSLKGQLPKKNFSSKGIIAALLTAICISIYSAIDGAAVRFVSPASYTIVVLGLSALFTAPAIMARYGWQAVTIEWKASWWRILIVGVLMMCTYIVVLWAYSITRVSYAGAVREVSVVFAALIGWLWLGEGFGPTRTLGATCIFAGILVIALLG